MRSNLVRLHKFDVVVVRRRYIVLRMQPSLSARSVASLVKCLMGGGASDSAFYGHCNSILILDMCYNITEAPCIYSSLANATFALVECHGVQLSSSLQQSRFNEIPSQSSDFLFLSPLNIKTFKGKKIELLLGTE
jgi:hypothetical protein